jgi:hypothetical protein
MEYLFLNCRFVFYTVQYNWWIGFDQSISTIVFLISGFGSTLGTIIKSGFVKFYICNSNFFSFNFQFIYDNLYQPIVSIVSMAILWGVLMNGFQLVSILIFSSNSSDAFGKIQNVTMICVV